MNSIATGYLFNHFAGIHLAYGLALVLLLGGTYIALASDQRTKGCKEQFDQDPEKYVS